MSIRSAIWPTIHSRPRFFAYLSLFTFAMLMLVTADNLVQMFFGWEGVGLASYLLIGFWYERPSANAAAIKAFVVNRVGDFGFALGIFLVFALTGSVSFDAVFAAAPGIAGKTIHVFGADFDALTITCLLLFMGAMGKSAQFLLHTWLPDAMEGPTPVSALIHAATMVTAGVFMVARLSPLFDLAPVALSVVTVVGATTAFFAATVGLVQNDIKRVIAYSTCSQLGYMFVGLGVGGYSLGIFHLFTHAFFKALLFLGAGSVINAMHHEQDMREMGGLRKDIPFTYWMMVIGTLALTGVGIPFTSIGFAGFVSKDAIIEAAYASQRPGAVYAFLCVVIAAGFTSFYSWRLIFMTFFGERALDGATRMTPMHHGHAAPSDHGHADHDDHGHGRPSRRMNRRRSCWFRWRCWRSAPSSPASPSAMSSSAAASRASGRARCSSAPDNHILEEMETAPWLVSLLPTLMMLGGFALAYYMYIVQPDAPRALWPSRTRSSTASCSTNGISTSSTTSCSCGRRSGSARLFWKGGDGFIIDGLGPDGVSARVIDVTRNVVRLQTGYIYHYAFAMLLGVAAFITWFLLGGIR